VIIIGGGLAGLISAIQLARAGISCGVIEKKAYPFHRVCGEYISNEVVPFLRSIDLFPSQFNPPLIHNFLLSAVSGKSETIPLDLGGFGISRYTFDNFLYERAKAIGVKFFLNEEVEFVAFSKEKFQIKTQLNELEADVVVGTFGKRSKIDHLLNRKFIGQRSPYVGVKYHIRTRHPNDLIALHNFPGGYCGMSNIEDGKTTLCYLSRRDNLKRFGNIRAMEENILFKNPLLRSVFIGSEFLFRRPEVINEISFVTKSPVEDHILMAGDSAGMIAPLCGNGMAMAIQSAKLLSERVIQYVTERSYTREQLEKSYEDAWSQHFKRRLWMGRKIQKLFGNAITSNLAVHMAIHVRSLANAIVRNTHGDPF
jgi:menaquinone-9 beta-reductase